MQSLRHYAKYWPRYHKYRNRNLGMSWRYWWRKAVEVQLINRLNGQFFSKDEDQS